MSHLRWSFEQSSSRTSPTHATAMDFKSRRSLGCFPGIPLAPQFSHSASAYPYFQTAQNSTIRRAWRSLDGFPLCKANTQPGFRSAAQTPHYLGSPRAEPAAHFHSFPRTLSPTLWDAFQFSTADAGLPRVAAVAGCPTKAFAARPETLLEARRARDVVVGSETAAMASSPSLNAKDMLASVYDEAEVAAKAYALEFMRYYRRAVDEYCKAHALVSYLLRHSPPSGSTPAQWTRAALYPGNPTSMALEKSGSWSWEGSHQLDSTVESSPGSYFRRQLTKHSTGDTFWDDKRLCDSAGGSFDCGSGNTCSAAEASSPLHRALWEVMRRRISVKGAPGTQGASSASIDRDTQSEPEIVLVGWEDIIYEQENNHYFPNADWWRRRFEASPLEFRFLIAKRAIKRCASEGNLLVHHLLDQGAQKPPFFPFCASPLRFTRFDILRAVWIDLATTTIQKWWRGYQGRKKTTAERQYLLEFDVQQAWHSLASASATKIQRGVRRWQTVAAAKQELVTRRLMLKRSKAATTIQRYWRRRDTKHKKELSNLVESLVHTRKLAAITIQRMYRGYKVRQFLDLAASHWLVCWTWDAPGAVVELVGDFTQPPWRKRILMTWHPTMQCYTVVLPRSVGRREFKFIVNGQYCCDGTLSVISDGAQHYNNVVRLKHPPRTPPFRALRKRLTKKISRLSTCLEVDASVRLPLRYTGTSNKDYHLQRGTPVSGYDPVGAEVPEAEPLPANTENKDDAQSAKK